MSQTLDDGEDAEVEGSSSTYTLSRKGNVYSCTCPAWRNQSATIDMRTCKHLRAYLGEDVEVARVGATNNMRAGTVRASGGGGASAKAAKETAPPVLLAHKWEVEHDPTGWWMSEKLDGVRAYWDGEGFLSRQGNKFFAPDWFVEALPADTLDGELWVGRKLFNKTISIVRSGAMGVDWKNVQYVIFDAPNAKGGFEERIAHAEKVIGAAESQYARVLEHVTCDGFEHLKEELARVEALGGEGLMLRKPKSSYEKGRSNSLLKVKTFHDTEGRVIGHAPGAGKHKGRLGALICELPNGTTFNVGTGFTDAEREDPPEIGTVITFRYQELTEDGVPRFPSWVGVRIDAEWPPKSEAKPVSQTVKKKAAPAAKPAKPTGSAKPTKAREDDGDDAGDDDADDDDDDAPVVKRAKPIVASGEVVKKKAVVYTPASTDDDDDDDDESSDDSDDDATPIVTKKAAKPAGSAKKSAPPPAADDDGSDDDDDIPIVASAKKRAPVAAATDDEDLAAESEDEDDEPAPPPKKKLAAGSVASAKKKAPPPPADDEEEEEEDEEEDEAAEDEAPAKPAADFFVSLVHPGENKFWEIEVRGKIHYTRFGKIGSPGQTRLTDVGSLTACKSDADKRAMVKRKEGYVAKKK